MRAAVLSLSLATALGAKYTLSSSVTHLSTPTALSTISWVGITEAAKGDWVALACAAPTGGYYYWDYTDGTPTGSIQMQLWANGKSSGCDSILVEYYSNNAVIGESGPITFPPLIQQIHLSVQSDPTVMTVDFVSSSPAAFASANCSYAVAGTGEWAVVPATTHSYTTIGKLSYAVMTGLAVNTTYAYSCQDGGAVSEVLTFVNQPRYAPIDDAPESGPAPGGPRPVTVAVFADFGVNDGFGLAQLAADAASGVFDLVLHAGDFAYDFPTGNSANGNFFMSRASTSYAAQFPTMVAPGNHEGAANFTEYKIRHAGIAAASAATNSSMFYSYEWSGVHFIAFNSETYVSGGVEEMTNWVRADLAAVDRARTPWVVAFAHKLWWMDSTDFSTLSAELQVGKVDILFAGHWHYYSRYVPYYPVTGQADTACLSADNHTYTDPHFMTMIVSGAPGDVERNDACPGDASIEPLLTDCSPAYGYGSFSAYNATHLFWRFVGDLTPIGDKRAGVASVTHEDWLWIKRSAPPAA